MTWALSFWTATSPFSPISAQLPRTSGGPAPGEAFGRHPRALRPPCWSAIKNRQIHRHPDPHFPNIFFFFRSPSITWRPHLQVPRRASWPVQGGACFSLPSERSSDTPPTVLPPPQSPPALFPPRSTCPARRVSDRD